MIEIIIATLLLFGNYSTGWASHYAPHVMDYPIEYHQLQTPCPGCAIAVADCSMIGDYWMIRPKGSPEWTPVVIADCAGNDGTPQWMAENGIIAELSYELADRFGAVGGGVEIEVMR